MTSKKINKFIVIDDNPLEIMLIKAIIRNRIKNLQIETFTMPQLALKFIEEEYGKVDENISTILLLDLHMPEMSGLEFLNRFKNFNAKIKDQFKIFVLTFILDRSEIEMAINHPCVTGLYSKPLTQEMLEQIIEKSDHEI